MDKMTIFYKKTNGKITNISSGLQDYSLFKEGISYAMENFDILVIDENDDILNNPRSYKISNGEVLLR